MFVNKEGKLGHCDVLEHEITIPDTCKPIRQRPYKLGAKQKEVLENMVTDMLNDGIIEPSTSPWTAPCLLVAKKNSVNSEYRFVVDFRQVNKCIELDAHPLPTIDDALESEGAKQPSYFSVLDLKSGFYQSAIHPKSRPYTAWRCHLGLFQFRRLPMGLKNSPQMFQRLMETVLHGLTFKFCLIYLDDIIVFSKTFQDHVQHLTEVFERLPKSGLKLHPKKCTFAKRQIKYLGHIVSEDGISPDPDKISAIRDYPTPTRVKNLRAFLGVTGYYRKFTKNYSSIAAPLYALTKKNANFTWTEECENAFQLLKNALISPPILAYPEYDKPFQLYTDASSYAVGAVLCQTQNGVERVICYAGRALSHAEQYGITEKECLALVYAVKKFDCYLRFTKFTAYVDHSALKWLLTLKEPTGKFARWITLIQSYDMKIVYRPGIAHGNADGVSRRQYENGNDQDIESFMDILPCGIVVDNSNTKVKTAIEHLPFIRTITDNDNTVIDNITKECMNVFSTEKLKIEQRKDSNFRDIINFLECGELPDDVKSRRNILSLQPFYFMRDGILYHINKKYKRHCKDTEMTIQLAVPRKLVPMILKETHDALLSGHLGINRTIQRTQRLFFWPSLGSDVAEWVQSCELCSQRKRPQKPTKSPISHMPIASQPFERVSTDILGPISTGGKSKNQYVLVFICYLTKYVELVPLNDIKASTVATAFLNNIVCRHGTPMFLHSDRGVNYLSHIVKETCRLLDIKKTQTTSYRPQCNGQSERMMSTIKDMLSKYIEDTSDWERYIPFIQFAYNTSPSIDSTDYSPFFLVYGRHPKSFLDSHLPNMDINVTAREYILQTLENIEKARDVARENLEEHKAEMLKKTNRDRETSDFNVGDIVYLFTPASTPGLSKKLRRPWTGPFYIVETLSTVHVKLRRKIDGKLLKNRIHVDRIKRGFVWTGEPRDPRPPRNEVEPLLLNENDIPIDNFVPTETDTDEEIVQTQNSDNTDNDNPDIENDVYTIEKILRKKKIRNKWTYRVKWLGFDSSQNSWVDFQDLTPECQQYVKEMHNKIPTTK